MGEGGTPTTTSLEHQLLGGVGRGRFPLSQSDPCHLSKGRSVQEAFLMMLSPMGTEGLPPGSAPVLRCVLGKSFSQVSVYFYQVVTVIPTLRE